MLWFRKATIPDGSVKLDPCVYPHRRRETYCSSEAEALKTASACTKRPTSEKRSPDTLALAWKGWLR